MTVTLSALRELSNTINGNWREIVEELKDLIGDGDELAEAIQHLNEMDDDFIVGDYRFIRGDAIDGILQEEIASDPYCLGCFKAEFIAECSGWPLALIEAAQKGEAYEALGQALIDEGKVEEMATRYAATDGYGHHFAVYDGEQHDIGPDYYAFRVN